VRWWDGTAWTEHTRDPNESIPAFVPPVPWGEFDTPLWAQTTERLPLPEKFEDGTATTVYVWVVALLPALVAASSVAVQFVLPGQATSLVGSIVLFILLLVFAYADNRQLRRRGFRPPDAPWAGLSPIIYLAIRVARVGRSSVLPLLATVTTAVVLVGSFVDFVVGGGSQRDEQLRIEALQPANLAVSLTGIFDDKNVPVEDVVCQPLASYAAGTQGHCAAISSGTTIDIVIVVEDTAERLYTVLSVVAVPQDTATAGRLSPSTT
jgi:hypothetical protein